MDQVLDPLGTVDRGSHDWAKPENLAVLKRKLENVYALFLEQVSEKEEVRQ